MQEEADFSVNSTYVILSQSDIGRILKLYEKIRKLFWTDIWYIDAAENGYKYLNINFGSTFTVLLSTGT